MMNSHCGICDVEKECGYQYKPCDCCNYRKFVPKEPPKREAVVIQFQVLKGGKHGWSD